MDEAERQAAWLLAMADALNGVVDAGFLQRQTVIDMVERLRAETHNTMDQTPAAGVDAQYERHRAFSAILEMLRAPM